MYRRFLILVVLVLLVGGGAGGTVYALSRGASEAESSERPAASVPARIAPAPSSQAGAAAPTLVNFQGILEDSQGTPISGSVQVTFRIHDAATDGMVLFEETQTVSVQGGLFSVLLGSAGGPIGLDSAVFYNLGAVAGDKGRGGSGDDAPDSGSPACPTLWLPRKPRSPWMPLS